LWANFSVPQFKLLHQVTKEIPNLDAAVLSAAECPEPVARRLLELVRRGRAEIGEHQAVLVGFDNAPALELRREIATRSHDDALEIDSGTTTAAAGAWKRVGQAVADTLGSPEFDHRTGGRMEQAAEVFKILDGVTDGAVASPGPSAD